MQIRTPAPNTVFWITEDASWPSIQLQCDPVPNCQAYTWQWAIVWDRFRQNGTETTPGPTWDAQDAVTNMGGALSVTVLAGGASATINLRVLGKQPTSASVVAYLQTKANSAGFDRILSKESGMKQFRSDGTPIKSGDNGYGMAQLTNPAPSFSQCWNWKLNIDGALGLYQSKQGDARTYLSQSGRSFTDDQLQRETIARWNGGAYHVWDDQQSTWVRNPNILCDSRTGNIGWNMSLPENQGQTEQQLHQRDSGSYARRHQAGDLWMYSGVCYADSILGS